MGHGGWERNAPYTRRRSLYIKKTIDSDTVISFLEKFSRNLEKPTVVVMDQASIHTSDKIFGKLEEWKKKNLEIFWLPAYSPKENLIEILWKFIKYEWIEIDAYKNLKTLLNYLKKVLTSDKNMQLILLRCLLIVILL